MVNESAEGLFRKGCDAGVQLIWGCERSIQNGRCGAPDADNGCIRIILRPKELPAIRVRGQWNENTHESVLAKIGEIIDSIVGVDRAEKRIVRRWVGQAALLKFLEAPFDVLGRELKIVLRHVAGGAAPAIAVDIREVEIKENPSTVRISSLAGTCLGLGASAHGDRQHED